MTLPARPHTIFSTLQDPQNSDTKPTSQGVKSVNAQPPTSPDVIHLNFKSNTRNKEVMLS